MRFRVFRRVSLLAIAASVVFVAASSTLGAAMIVIQNNDAAGVGFNDSTAVAAVGGNSGTTLGQQRLNAFQFAANVWGATLTSTTTITIRAQWTALACDANSAVLGSAGTLGSFRDFPNAIFANTWYSASLANKLSGSDLDPATAEMNANFNVNLGAANCLAGSPFYLGLDNNHGNGVDLVTVLLHEFGHGFGFSVSPTSASSGAESQGLPSVWERFLLDDTTGKTWNQMNDAERAASALNTRRLAWNGFQVTSAVPSVLGLGTPLLRVNSPAAIAGNYLVGTAAFGAALSSPGVTGSVVQALDAADGVGPTTTDGCSAFTNAGAVSGHIALIDRGTCAFILKVKNAQNAGAAAVLIVDNIVQSPPPGLGGTDATITIPSASITQADGNSIKAQLGSGVNATLTLDSTVRAGADQFNRALLFTPNPFQSGSSVSHWDTIEFPNQLMEPNISNDLTHSVVVPQDLTFALLRDVGWVTAAATNVQFSAANYNVGEGGVSATITVNRSGDISGASTVDFLTSDGTATQSQDYVVASGTLSFAAGEISKTFSVLIIDDAFVEANKTLNVTLSNPVGAVLAAPSTATVTITDNDTAGATSPAPKRFAAALDGLQETPPNNALATIAKGTGLVLLDGPETSAKVGLQFQNLSSTETAAHIHGNGLPGVPAPILFTLTTTPVNPIVNSQILPTTQQVADLKAGLHYQNVHSNNFPNGEIRGQLLWNPTLEENFFVRQQYLDFLSRDGDPGGFNFWIGQITPCQANAQCFHDSTIFVSDAFFFEPEFQQTAGFVFRAYRAAFGNTQPFPNPNGTNPAEVTEANKLVDYSTFVADRARVVGGANLATAQLAFANLFASRSAFTTKYAAATTGPQFVAAILATIQNADGVDLSAQTTALVNEYNTGGRGQVLYRLADDNAQNPIDNQAFINAEYNRQFALTLYFGYLRRNPDMFGFLFWQSQINLAPVRDVAKQNALVCSFITAGEYQFRFGPSAPRTNGECPQ